MSQTNNPYQPPQLTVVEFRTERGYAESLLQSLQNTIKTDIENNSLMMIESSNDQGIVTQFERNDAYNTWGTSGWADVTF